MQSTIDAPKLIDAETLRQKHFDENCRPTLRTIRNWQRAKIIPSIRLGRLIFFDPDAVRAALARRSA